MKTLIGLTLIALITLLLASPILAQQQQGDVELQIAASYQTYTGVDEGGGTFTGQTKLGYYFTDGFELGTGLLYSRDLGEPRSWVLGLLPFASYSVLLKDSKTVPYIAAQYFLIIFPMEEYDFATQEYKDKTETFSYMGLTAGVKQFISPKTAIDLSGNYAFSLEADAEGGLLTFLIGLAFLL